MRKMGLCAIAIKPFALLGLLITAHHATAQSPTTPRPATAPIGRYLVPDHNAEIALARTAAPDSISRNAEVLVLQPTIITSHPNHAQNYFPQLPSKSAQNPHVNPPPHLKPRQTPMPSADFSSNKLAYYPHCPATIEVVPQINN